MKKVSDSTIGKAIENGILAHPFIVICGILAVFYFGFIFGQWVFQMTHH